MTVSVFLQLEIALDSTARHTLKECKEFSEKLKGTGAVRAASDGRNA